MDYTQKNPMPGEKLRNKPEAANTNARMEEEWVRKLIDLEKKSDSDAPWFPEPDESYVETDASEERTAEEPAGRTVPDTPPASAHRQKTARSDEKKGLFRVVAAFITIAWMEVAFQYFVYGSFTWGMVYGTIFAIPAACLGSLLSGFGPRWLKKILFSLYLSVFAVFILAQLVYHTIFPSQFLTVYSVFNGRGGKNAMDFLDVIGSTILQQWWKLLLIALPYLVYLFVLLPKRRMHWSSLRIRSLLLLLASLAAASVLSFLSLGLAGDGLNSPLYYYKNRSNQPMNFKNLGVVTAMRLDAVEVLTGPEQSLALSPVSDPASESGAVSAGTPAESSDAQQSSEAERIEAEESAVSSVPEEAEPEATFVREPQILDIDFESLAQQTENETLRQLHEYFNSKEPTYTNQYTGMFEGYNLILITGEAFSRWAIDEELTPTLYKMANNGFVFDNFYQPIYYVSTSDGEYVTDTGLLPRSDCWSYETSANVQMPFAFGNQFNALGYACFAYHDHTYDYYTRELSYPNMGYIYKGLYNGLDIPAIWTESDLDMMKATVDDYIHEEQFHAYYMTVSGHLQYNFQGNKMCIKNYEAVRDLDVCDANKAYLACNIELDRAMEYLLNALEEEGVADHTVIVLSPDHYPYGLTNEQITELNGGVDVSQNWELFKTSLILYCPGMEEKVTVDKYCCALDVTPTLCNLFDLPYDSRLMAGRDILSDSDGLVIMNDYSFLNDKVSYNTTTGEAVFTGEGQDAIYLDSLIRYVNDCYTISGAILNLDYYSTLTEYLPWWDGESKGRLFDPAVDRLCIVPEDEIETPDYERLKQMAADDHVTGNIQE